MPKAIRVTAPFLTDEERHQITNEPGGLSGSTADTSKLLGKWDPKNRTFPASSQAMVALQQLGHIYAGPVTAFDHEGNPLHTGRRLTVAKIEKRRARNKVAKASRRVNR